MKKLVSVFIIIPFTICLVSCTHSEYLNFASFVDNYNHNDILDYQSFISFYDENKGSDIFSCTIRKEKSTVLLNLITDENSRINQCSITIAKCSENADKINLNSSDINNFKSVCKNAVSAYTYKTSDDSEKLLADFDFKKAAATDSFEQTKGEGSYYMILLSNELSCEFIIKNRWLCDIETTQKPDNKNDFVENTSIRTETVPLR